MNCGHVLGLIDAGALADYPPAHLAAAWRHARECPTCGPVLEMSRVMTRDLAGLLHPDPDRDRYTAPPAHFAVAVAARIAQLDTPPRALRDAGRARRTSPVADWWPAVSTVAGGVIAGVALLASLPPGEWTIQRFAALWTGWMGADSFLPPATSGGMLALTGGVLLFVIGLFYGRDVTERMP
jgi:hypothetical protein